MNSLGVNPHRGLVCTATALRTPSAARSETHQTGRVACRRAHSWLLSLLMRSQPLAEAQLRHCTDYYLMFAHAVTTLPSPSEVCGATDDFSMSCILPRSCLHTESRHWCVPPSSNLYHCASCLMTDVT